MRLLRCVTTINIQGRVHERNRIMLILKRRKGEEIIVNERMRIVVMDTGGGSCSLAFDAPMSDKIRRAELPAFEECVIQQTASHLRLVK
jgi:carbon storage regulator CsrA